MHTINYVLVRVGFVVTYKILTNQESEDIIYYAKLTSNYELLRSPYHPIHLRSIMVEKKLNIPKSFELLFIDIDYLPNINNLWQYDNNIVSLTFRRAIFTQEELETIGFNVIQFP